MRIHVLVEGKSEQAFIERWGPRAFPEHEIIPHAHEGKGELPSDPSKPPDAKQHSLLHLLPATLRAFGKMKSRSDEAVIVLVDADRDGCEALKTDLVEMAKRIKPLPRVLFRIAVEETEAFYLGDVAGLKRAFPDADTKKARAYVPDSICNTAELFGDIVGDAGLDKVAWAEVMGDALTTRPQGSKSPSFKAFYAAFGKLSTAPKTAVTPQPKTKPKKHWKARHPSLRKGRGRG